MLLYFRKIVFICGLIVIPPSQAMAPAHPQLSVQDLIDQNRFPEPVNGFIDLEGKGLTSLAGIEKIPNPNEVTGLDLANNQINDIPDQSFDQLLNLRWLALTNNPLVRVKHNSFKKLENLVELYLQDNQLVEIAPQSFEGQTKLKTLNIANNKLQDLPKGIFDSLIELETLDLQNNKLNSLHPDLFEHVLNLSALSLRRNQLTELPRLTQLNKLKELYIAQNKGLNKLPKNLIAFIWSHNIRVDKAKLLRSIPNRSAGDVIAAQGENWQETLLVPDPDTEDGMILNLDNQGLTSLNGLSSELGTLLITKVTAKNNYITEIPHDFFMYTEEDEIFLRFAHLTHLNFANNQILAVPKNLHALVPKIAASDLSGNRLPAIPEGTFNNLRELKVLELDNNKITNIEDGALNGLGKLEEFYAPNNKMHILRADTFKNLSNLRMIILRGNNLGSKDQYIFPPKAKVIFYPQQMPALKLLVAKKVTEGLEQKNLIEITLYLRRVPADMVNALLQAASKNVAVKINKALRIETALAKLTDQMSPKTARKKLAKKQAKESFKLLPKDMREALFALAPDYVREKLIEMGAR